MTKKELLTKLAALGTITDEQRNSVVCALIGHSRIVGHCFGQVTCGRCRDIIGDTLAGVWDASNDVIVEHNCEKCRTNYAACTWKDKLFAEDPFPKEE